MRLGVSTLNPFAASYIPLSKREQAGNVEVPGMNAKPSHSGNQTVWYPPAEHTAQNRQHDKPSSFTEVSTLKSHSGYGFCGSSSQSPSEIKEKQMVDEEADMDLEFLRMTFPGISYESLADVYIANKGDLEAAIDMLNQLEFDTLESSENLPDTLDIGDVSESRSSAERSSDKMKTVVGETTASSSGSLAPESVVVT